MKNNSFWSVASRCGAIYGGVDVAFRILVYLSGSISFMQLLVNVVQIASLVSLVYLFTMRRSRSMSPEEGFSFGAGVKFILALSLFAGIITGAYEILARNLIYPERYRELIDMAMMTVSQSGTMSIEQLSSFKSLYTSAIFSPIWVLCSELFALLFRGLFFGVLLAGFTRRAPQIFNDSTPTE